MRRGSFSRSPLLVIFPRLGSDRLAVVVSVPLRYMHSPVEMVQLDDVDNAARLIAAFVRRLGPDLDFRR